MATEAYDLAIIGGGINGCGIARDAAGRGLAVYLCEQNDLGSATSSASTKLIHGGLRYLEYHEFRLVREALAEREVLLRLAPHIIWPLRFVLPHRPEMRPRWLIRAGLFLYDHLAKRPTLPGAAGFATAGHPYGAPLSPAITHAFAYSDAWVEDSRLVVLNARDAAARGATVLTRTRFTNAVRHADHWAVTLEGKEARSITARAVVNAAGPWVAQALAATHEEAAGAVRLIRGSHIVLPRLYEGDQAYILQNDDRRVVFVIPYEERFSLVGTTDVPQDGDPGQAVCTDAEAEYLCTAVSRQFRQPVTVEQIVWRYAGVRPLFDDGSDDPSAVTRDYVLRLDEGRAPMLTVYGGKITTFRRLAEDAVGMVGRALGRPGVAWTAGATLPGGDLEMALGAFEGEMARRYPWLGGIGRLVRRHGSELPAMLGDARGPGDLGEDFGAGLTEREVAWMVTHEWAVSAADILWRRSRLGLHMTPAQIERLTARLG